MKRSIHLATLTLIVAATATAAVLSFDPTLYRLFAEGERSAVRVDQFRCIAHERGAAALRHGPERIKTSTLEGEGVRELARIHKRQKRGCKKYLKRGTDPQSDARLLAAWQRTWEAGVDITEVAAIAREAVTEAASVDRLVYVAERDAARIEEIRDQIVLGL